MNHPASTQTKLWEEVLLSFASKTQDQNLISMVRSLDIQQDRLNETLLLQTTDEFEENYIRDTCFEEIKAIFNELSPKQKIALQIAPPNTIVDLDLLSTESVETLDLFEDIHPDARMAPSSILRSSMFGVVQRGKRQTFQRELLASWPDCSIYYTGEQLDQADLDLWMAAIQMARGEDINKAIPISLRKLMEAAGKSWGKSTRLWAERSTERLIQCCVIIETPSFTYKGNFIHALMKDHQTNKYTLRLNPDLIKLFKNGFTAQSWVPRKNLKRDLSKWLMGYVSSHKATKDRPHEISISKLYKLCGSTTARQRDFVTALRAALKELIDNDILIDDLSLITKGKQELKLVFVRTKKA